MTAHPRRPAAVKHPRHSGALDLYSDLHRDSAATSWSRALELRREWLGHGLDTRPADRIAAERALARIYARLSRPRPRMVWVDSPFQALPLLAGLPTHGVLQSWIMSRTPSGAPPLISDLLAALSRLRSALDDCDRPEVAGFPSKPRKPTGVDRQAWSRLAPLEALDAGVPLGAVLRRGVWQALRTCLVDGFNQPVRAALGPVGGLPSACYGQQESWWIAYHDVLRRLGLARYRPADVDHLDDWATLARSCGWWWPDEQVCVVVERPAAVRTEPVPAAPYGEIRLCRDGQPAVRYRDGWYLPPEPGPGVAGSAAGAGAVAARLRKQADTLARGIRVNRPGFSGGRFLPAADAAVGRSDCSRCSRTRSGCGSPGGCSGGAG